MTSGFQNHLHFIYGLPGGWVDTSDGATGAYAKKVRAYKRRERELEEQIAAQILKERLAKKASKKASLKAQVERKLDEGIPESTILQTVDSEALRLEVEGIIAQYQAKLAAEIQTRIKKRRVRALKILLLFATMDD